MSHKPTRRENPLKQKRNFAAYLKFMFAAVLILLLVEHFMWGEERPYVTKMKADYKAEQAAKLAEEQAKQEKIDGAISDLLPPPVEFSDSDITNSPNSEVPTIVKPEDGEDYFEAPDVPDPLAKNPTPQSFNLAPSMEPPLQTKPRLAGKPKIAIVIDDLGMNVKESRIAIDLAPQVTLALLPYAHKIDEMAKDAKNKGHEIIIHTPMEAMKANVSLGGLGLTEGMTPAVFKAEFNKMAASFEGYDGINNHMGSRLTQDPKAMAMLMAMLKERGLFFLDSKTIATSIAADTARAEGVPYAVRDVFLDHQETPEFVREALKQVEHIANRYGSVIAIGHPKDNTMKALQHWIPTLQGKGFELVKLSELVIQPEGTPKKLLPQEKTPIPSWAPSTDFKLQHISAPETLKTPVAEKQAVAVKSEAKPSISEPVKATVATPVPEEKPMRVAQSAVEATAPPTALIGSNINQNQINAEKIELPAVAQPVVKQPAAQQAVKVIEQPPPPVAVEQVVPAVPVVAQPAAITSSSQPVVAPVQEAPKPIQQSSIVAEPVQSIAPSAGVPDSNIVESAAVEGQAASQEVTEEKRSYDPNKSDAGFVYPGQEIQHPLLLE